MAWKRSQSLGSGESPWIVWTHYTPQGTLRLEYIHVLMGVSHHHVTSYAYLGNQLVGHEAKSYNENSIRRLERSLQQWAEQLVASPMDLLVRALA